MPTTPRRRILQSAGEVPIALIDEVIDDMAARMAGTQEARKCEGLSFSYRVTDRRVSLARYDVQPRGRIVLTRNDSSPTTFSFSGAADAFDQVLRGQAHALTALMTRRIHLHGSLLHIRGLLRMMPAVHRAYSDAREAMIQRHADRYDFRF
jgi:hypothetical protein